MWYYLYLSILKNKNDWDHHRKCEHLNVCPFVKMYYIHNLFILKQIEVFVTSNNIIFTYLVSAL